MSIPVTIPYAFANATTTQSLSSLDANFNALANGLNGLSNGSSKISVSSISATGTANATTYLRGDGAWATVAGGGGNGTVTSIDANSTIGFSFTGGPITSSGTLTLSGPAPGTSGNVLTSNGTSWISQGFSSGANFQNRLWTGFSCTGSISGTTLTVTAVSGGLITPDSVITGTGVTAGTKIVAQLTGTFGSTGTYTVSASQTVSSTTISSSSGSWTCPAGVTLIRATVIAGGSGAYNDGTGANQGAAGGAAIGYYTVTPSTVYTATVGAGSAGVLSGTSAAGGSSSFGSLLSATGGSGASVSAAGTGGAGTGGILVNSYSSGTSSVGGGIQYFRTGTGASSAVTGSSTAKYWTPTGSANNTYIAGTGGSLTASPGYGGVGGIVFIEYVG